MSSYKMHLFVGIVLWALLTAALLYFNILSPTKHIAIILLGIPISLLFSIFADLDSESSFIFRKYHLFSLILVIVLIALAFFKKLAIFYFGAIAVLLLSIAIIFLKHRGVMHDVITALAIASIFALWNWVIALYLLIAYLGH